MQRSRHHGKISAWHRWTEHQTWNHDVRGSNPSRRATSEYAIGAKYRQFYAWSGDQRAKQPVF
jgi:hypothetical protein